MGGHLVAFGMDQLPGCVHGFSTTSHYYDIQMFDTLIVGVEMYGLERMRLCQKNILPPQHTHAGLAGGKCSIRWVYTLIDPQVRHSVRT